MERSISFRLSCLCIMLFFLKLTVSQSEMDPLLLEDDNVSSPNWSNEGILDEPSKQLEQNLPSKTNNQVKGIYESRPVQQFDHKPSVGASEGKTLDAEQRQQAGQEVSHKLPTHMAKDERGELDGDELNPQVDRKVSAKVSERKDPYKMQEQQHNKKIRNMKSKEIQSEDLNTQPIDHTSSTKAPSKDLLDEPMNQLGQKLPANINDGKVLEQQGNQNASMNRTNGDEGKDLGMSSPQTDHVKPSTKVHREDDNIKVSTNSNEGRDSSKLDQQADQKSLSTIQHNDQKLPKTNNRNKNHLSQPDNIDENQQHLKESAKKSLPMQDDDRLNQLEIEFRKSIAELKLQNEEQRAEIKHLKGKRTESDARLRATQEEVQSLKVQLEIQTMNVQQLEQTVKKESDDKHKGKSHQNTISITPKSCWDLNNIGNSYDGFYLVKGRRGEDKKIKIIFCSFNQPGTHDGIDEKFVGFVDFKSFPDGIHFYVQKNNAALTEGQSNIIRFEQEKLDIGDAMNPDTGIFTAPANGTYHFAFTGTCNKVSDNSYVSLHHNKIEIGRSSSAVSPSSQNSPSGSGGRKYRRALKGFGFNSVAMGAAIGRAASSSQSRPKAQTVQHSKPSASNHNMITNKQLTEKPAMKPMKKSGEEESEDETEEEEETEVTEAVPLNPFLQRKMKSTSPAPQLTTKTPGVFGGLQSLYSNLFQKKEATQQQQNISSESINPPSSPNSNIITMTLQSVLKLEVGDRVYMNSYVKALPGVPAVCTAHFTGSLLEQA